MASIFETAMLATSITEPEPLSAENKSIWKEFTPPGYLGRARARSQLRTSPWNVPLIPLVFGGLGFIGYALFKMMWFVHTYFYPAHAGRLGEFWGADISGRSFISSFLLAVPLFFAALPLSLMLANCAMWCVPAAREAFMREGQADPWLLFPVAMRQLALISLFVVPVCLLLSLLGAVTLKSLK